MSATLLVTALPVILPCPQFAFVHLFTKVGSGEVYEWESEDEDDNSDDNDGKENEDDSDDVDEEQVMCSVV